MKQTLPLLMQGQRFSVLIPADDKFFLDLPQAGTGSFAGGNVVLTAETDSTGYVSEEGRCQLSAETIEKIDAAYEKVKSGEIVPAANFNGVTPDTFEVAE